LQGVRHVRPAFGLGQLAWRFVLGRARLAGLSWHEAMTVAVSAQICPSIGGGVESNLISMFRSDFWNDVDFELLLLATPPYTQDLAKALGERLRVVPWSLGEDVVRRHFPEGVARGRLIREKLGYLRPAFDAGVLLYRILRYGRSAPAEGEVDSALHTIGVRAVHFPTSNLFRTSLPFIYEPWDLQYLHFPDFFDRKELHRRHTKYSYGCANATFIVVPTRWGKEDLISRLNIEARKIVVIRRGSEFASAPTTDAQCAAIVRAAGIDPGFAFYPAMGFPHKNHVTLFRALGHLRAKKGLNIRLVMTGRSYAPFAAALERSIKDSGVADQICVLGPVPETTLTALYRMAHAVVFPSLFEGLGLPLLEALKNRTPVLAANATCIPEVIGRAGVLFDPLDHVALAEVIERAWRDPEWLKQPLQHASEQLALFDWDEARTKFRALYRKLDGRSLGAQDEALLAVG
jgi:glycosyltransferase involved in cell wall biosynthesis